MIPGESTGHTPGPWRINRFGGYRAIEQEDRGGQCTVVIDHVRSEADARLVAAAPDLLAAAKAAERIIGEFMADGPLADDDLRDRVTLDALGAAIARAEGGAS